MFNVIVLACVIGLLSATSVYYNKEEPNLYEEVFYSDSSPDENVAAMDYFRKREAEEESEDGWNFTPWVYDRKDFASNDCIYAKVCDDPSSGTDSAIAMVIYTNQGPNSTRLCGTNPLDFSFVNDWETGRIAKYCGKFLGDCLGKTFGDNFEVVLHASNALLHFFGRRDDLCLDWIKHVQPGLPEEHSISAGWSEETEGPDQIRTIFD